MRTIFKRRSPLHPFLSSLGLPVLARVPILLRGPERADMGRRRAAPGVAAGPRRAGGGEDPHPLPDRILDDFFLAYRLYLLAWTRIAAESLSPALFICEGVDGYHPAARQIIERLFDDLLVKPGLRAGGLQRRRRRPPRTLPGFDLHPLYVHPLGKREIRSLAQHLFPGLAMPESLTRRLRRRSGGLYVSVVSYLQYLARTGPHPLHGPMATSGPAAGKTSLRFRPIPCRSPGSSSAPCRTTRSCFSTDCTSPAGCWTARDFSRSSEKRDSMARPWGGHSPIFLPRA